MANPPDGFETLLILSSMGTPLYSARGLIQTLRPIQQSGYLLRDINGELCNLSSESFQKFASTITGTDQQSPSFAFPGMPVTVDCICEISEPTSNSSGTTLRTPVTGTETETEISDGSFTSYRPQLDMMVTDLTIETDEWGAQVSWTLSLEEV